MTNMNNFTSMRTSNLKTIFVQNTVFYVQRPQHYMGVGQRHALATLYPQGKDPSTHWTRDWVGPRACLDAEVRRKILCP
jgi:hypothetical protein